MLYVVTGSGARATLHVTERVPKKDTRAGVQRPGKALPREDGKSLK